MDINLKGAHLSQFLTADVIPFLFNIEAHFRPTYHLIFIYIAGDTAPPVILWSVNYINKKSTYVMSHCSWN